MHAFDTDCDRSPCVRSRNHLLATRRRSRARAPPPNSMLRCKVVGAVPLLFDPCREALSNLSAAHGSLDDALPADLSAHLFDSDLLDALRHHTCTHAPSLPAQKLVHIIDAPIYASFVVARVGMLGGIPGHVERMERLRAVLARLLSSSEDGDTLLVMPYWNVAAALTPGLLKLFCHRRDVILGTIESRIPDMMISIKTNAIGCFRRTVTLPYRAHFLADQRAVVEDGAQAPRRHIGLMFHGSPVNDKGRQRHDRSNLHALENEGALRETQFDIKLSKSVGLATTQNENLVTIMHNTIDAYRNSSICLVPEGDTVTSRRLFDVLATGCVPLILRTHIDRFLLDLPFPKSVLWHAGLQGYRGATQLRSQILFFSLWPTELNATAAWLQHILGDKQTLDSMRAAGQLAFRNWLSYRHNVSGVADALVTELADMVQWKVSGDATT